MNIGGPIVVGVLGAILYFATREQEVAGFSVPMIGLILVIAAVLWLVLGLVMNRPRSQVTTESTHVQGAGGGAPAAGGMRDEHVEREVRHDEA